MGTDTLIILDRYLRCVSGKSYSDGGDIFSFQGLESVRQHSGRRCCGADQADEGTGITQDSSPELQSAPKLTAGIACQQHTVFGTSLQAKAPDRILILLAAPQQALAPSCCFEVSLQYPALLHPCLCVPHSSSPVCTPRQRGKLPCLHY